MGSPCRHEVGRQRTVTSGDISTLCRHGKTVRVANGKDLVRNGLVS